MERGTAMEQRDYLLAKLVARRWGISHRTLERWRRKGRGPAYLKIGGRVFYRLDDVKSYEAEQSRPRFPSPAHAAFGVAQ
jgi:predicted site-specific integrase-resolvase